MVGKSGDLDCLFGFCLSLVFLVVVMGMCAGNDLLLPMLISRDGGGHDRAETVRRQSGRESSDWRT